MERFNIFQDIAERTGGSIYIGVVGPVRTGKSTFIKRFMDLLVMPNIEDRHVRERTQDELPQSAAGKTIMTTEPKFVPEQPVEIFLDDGLSFKIRLVDCVGYSVQGARGYEEDGGPRMVRTPWFVHEIPFQQAAEMGTRKVIADHSTLGLVVTTDGSITDIPREGYLEAEQRVIGELKELGKPFLVILNSTHPQDPKTQALAEELTSKHGVTVLPLNCLQATEKELLTPLHQVLYEFPLRDIGFRFSRWLEELDREHWLVQKLEELVDNAVISSERLRDVQSAVATLSESEFLQSARLTTLDLGRGAARVDLTVPSPLFYQVLQELTGFEVKGDHDLIRLMRELTVAKREYDKLAEALRDVREEGYGIVNPSLEDIVFDSPELIRRGHRLGVRLRASAPSIHMVKANIVTEVTPLVGTEKQGEELVLHLSREFEEDPAKVWRSDFLGQSLQELVKQGIQSKLRHMPENARVKLQEALTKIINEGSGGLICIIL